MFELTSCFGDFPSTLVGLCFETFLRCFVLLFGGGKEKVKREMERIGNASPFRVMPCEKGGKCRSVVP